MTVASVRPSSAQQLAALTEAQEGLWYAQRLDPGNPVFNTAQFMDLQGAVDLEALESAIATAMAEADGLRLRIVETDSGPLQRLADDRPAVQIVDCRAEGDPAASARAGMQRDLARAIDLSRESAVAQHVYLLADDRVFWYQRVHHVAIDGYGTELLTRRICDLYRAAVSGSAPATRPFGEYARVLEADAAYRQSPERERDRAYWIDQFGDRPVVGSLSDRTAMTDRWYRTRAADLPPALVTRLERVSAEVGVSWPDIATALVGAYVRRHIRDADTVIGVPAMLRLGAPSARVPAMVMNVLPLRVSGDETQPTPAFLRGAAAALREARRHGRYRSEQLRRDLGLLGDNRRLYGPLVNVLPFTSSPQLPGLAAKLQVLNTGPVDDLTISIRGDVAGTRLQIELDGHPGLYDEASLDEHASRLAEFLDRSLAAGSLAEVETATGHERTYWTQTVNRTAHPVPPATLVTLIERTMASQPEAPAVTFEDRTLSYGELERLTRELAGRLAALHSEPGIVAVFLPRSIELQVALVGILRAGAAYLPIDLETPRDRIETMFASAQPLAVLTLSALRDRLPSTRPIWCLDDERPAAPAAAAVRPPRERDPAYVIYTSGSTGVPKGVVIEHQAIVNRLEWMRQHYGFDRDERILQKTPATFDVSVWEFFLPLLCGGTLVFAPPDAHRDPAWLARLIREHRITTLHFVPSMLAQFLEEPSVKGLRLRRVFCSGEALPAALRDRFHAIVDAELHNLYGPTEAAVDVSYWDASRHDRSPVVPIGRPVWNTRLYVLDARRRPVPPGVTGDLYLAGVQLAREYLGQPDLTAERFVTDPFVAGDRMYHTGDLARWRRDGAVEFLGRSDHQVKIRGLRVEPGEIEAALRDAADVAHAVVLLREDRPGDQRLVAYLVANGPGDLDLDALRTTLQRRLPSYMVPSAFVLLDALPLNASGKLDRKRLPPPAIDAAAGRAPRKGTETRVAAIFGEVLGLPDPDSVRAESDFFALGGHSLLAVQVVRRIEAECGCRLGLGTVFSRPTVETLAAAVDAARAGEEPGGIGAAIGEGFGVLLKLASGPAQPPLFCIHPAGGISWCYGQLARTLQPAREVYGVQARGLSQDQPLPASLDAMAQDYVSAVRSVQPRGPYHLLGWSVGGIIAHGMAAALEADGERVATLAMLDAYPSDRWRSAVDPDEAAALNAIVLIAGLDASRLPSPLTRDRVLGALRESSHPLGSLSDEALSGVLRVVLHNNRLVRRHQHAVVDAAIAHFRAALDHEGEAISPDEWAPYTRGGLRTHDVPSRHAHMVGAAASRVIAAALAGTLT